MKYICTLIVVEDISKSRFLYETILGQKVITDFGENVAFEGGFAIHKKDHFQKLINNQPIFQRSHSFELYFEEDDLEPLAKKINEYGIEVIHPIKEQPWKQQVIRFYDYDQHIIEVGERMEHVAYRLSTDYSISEISKITYLAEDKVREAILEYSHK